jgi:hypothetical protein
MAVNPLHYGIAALAGSAANTYLTGPTTAGGTKFQTFGQNQSLGSSLTGSAMNFLGISPPGQMTGLPGMIQTGLTNLVSGKGLLGTGMNTGMSEGDFFQGMNQFPNVTRVSSTPIRSDTNFGVSAASQIPLGSNGRVSRALSKPQMQQYIAKSVRGIKVPGRILAGQTAVGSSSLGKMSVKRSATRTPTYTRDTATPTGKV